MRDFNRDISVKEMQIQDKNSSDYGITPSILMECAGYSAAQKIIEKFHLKKEDHVTLLCGLGNNGGDGFVIARHLLSNRVGIHLILVGYPENIHTLEAKQKWEMLLKLHLNLSIHLVKDSSFFKAIPKETRMQLNKSKVIVDCLLGTGIKGKIREPVRSAIEFINSFSESKSKIIAIDVPSGIDPDSGEKSDVWVKADLIITFHKKKKGFSKIDVKTIINPIGIPIDADLFIGSGDLQFTLPKRKIDNHKGQFGKALIIGGSEEYSGAPALAGLAALQMGIDLVYIYAPKNMADVIRTYSPNLIVHSGVAKNLTLKDTEYIRNLVEKIDAVVIGPGLGNSDETKEAYPEIIAVLKDLNKPVVVDANAIKLTSPLIGELPLNTVFTPHRNEFKELTGKKIPLDAPFDQVISFLEKTVKEWRSTFLIKGRFDYITNGEQTRINKTGVPEMAVGGTGDILTGILVAILSLGVDPFNAACCAAYINGKLGEYYQILHKGTIKNGAPLKSKDLLRFIPQVLKQDS
jgi:NAD(P)H-hydrate epimerase